jgi:hypothetical protein
MGDPRELPTSVLARALEESRRRVAAAEAELQRELRRDAADARRPGRAWRWRASQRRVNSARAKLGWARRRRRKIAAALGAGLLD